MEKIKNILNPNFVWNMLGTTFNAFNSLFFMIIVTRLNGTNEAGIFTIAFSTAGLLFYIGVYAGRIYQVSDVGETTDKDYIYNRVISIILLMLSLFGYLFYKQYDTYKASIFFALTLYRAAEAFSDVLYGILQKNDKLYIVGKSYFYKSFFSLLCFLILDILTKNLFISCMAIFVVFTFFILVYDIPQTRKVISKDSANYKRIFNIFVSGFFVFAITFLGIYLINAPKYAIDGQLGEDMQAIFGIILMPASVLSLFAQFLIHPYLTNIVNLFKEGKIKEVKKLITRMNLIILGFGGFCILCAYLVGIPVLNIMYGIKLDNYKMELVIILTGAIFNVISVIYSAILTTMRHTFIQFVIYIFTTVVAFVSSYQLTKVLGVTGASYAYFVIMCCQFVLYFVVSNILLKKAEKEG